MRLDPVLKREAYKVFDELGLNMSSAVTIFLKAVVREQGLPFGMTTRPKMSEPTSRVSAITITGQEGEAK